MLLKLLSMTLISGFIFGAKPDPTSEDVFKVLGLETRTPTERELKSAFRRALFLYHQDYKKGTDEELKQQIHMRRLIEARDEIQAHIEASVSTSPSVVSHGGVERERGFIPDAVFHAVAKTVRAAAYYRSLAKEILYELNPKNRENPETSEINSYVRILERLLESYSSWDGQIAADPLGEFLAHPEFDIARNEPYYQTGIATFRDVFFADSDYFLHQHHLRGLWEGVKLMGMDPKIRLETRYDQRFYFFTQNWDRIIAMDYFLVYFRHSECRLPDGMSPAKAATAILPFIHHPENRWFFIKKLATKARSPDEFYEIASIGIYEKFLSGQHGVEVLEWLSEAYSELFKADAKSEAGILADLMLASEKFEFLPAFKRINDPSTTRPADVVQQAALEYMEVLPSLETILVLEELERHYERSDLRGRVERSYNRLLSLLSLADLQSLQEHRLKNGRKVHREKKFSLLRRCLKVLRK